MPNMDFAYSREIPKVFAPHEAPRPIVVPEDVGMSVPEIPGLLGTGNRPPFRKQ